ncbi:conserved hypothetical protein [Coccidioides posadasii str. Silveira]|uniref:Uncharacterized protein n=1 Tax=Coccidioides posadasii (strain RMSCC 757 / Silveira) TaxID=443226 RepID=E9D0I5_COCPS|nr:conserved hypothetical protein [Coccidioides posadasii str. Silveira]
MAGRFSIEKFRVDLWDWQKWSNKDLEVRGIEDDAQRESNLQLFLCMKLQWTPFMNGRRIIENLFVSGLQMRYAICETTRKAFEDAKRWLRGSNDCTKLVIVVDIKKRMSRERTAETTDWGLSSKDVLGRLNSFDLTEHILQWHKDNKCSLVGSFQACFYLYFRNQ